MALETRTGGWEPPLTGEHDRLGAAWIELGGRRLAGHYGADAHVEQEYRAATDSSGVVDLPERALLEVTGPKRIDFLQRILSNDVADLQPGAGRLAALMNTKGHLIALMRVLVESARVRIELDRGRVDRVVDALEHYRVAAPVRFGRPDSATLALLGRSAPALLQGLGLEAPGGRDTHASGQVDGLPVQVCQASDLPRGSFVVHAERDSAERLWRRVLAAGARPVGRRALDALRIEQGRPFYGFDIGEENLLHETGLLGEYHSPAKGCYVGQEVVARLEARGGNVNRRLRGLRLGAPAPAGSEIESAGETVGALTSVAVSPRLGPIAMGYVHRSAAEPGQRVTVGGADATVRALPLESAGGATR